MNTQKPTHPKSRENTKSQLDMPTQNSKHTHKEAISTRNNAHPETNQNHKKTETVFA